MMYSSTSSRAGKYQYRISNNNNPHPHTLIQFCVIYLYSFTGALYPVNPRAKSINSVKCYPSITDIDDHVDLAMIILPPLAALKAVEASIAKGVQGIVIVSAGFREVGAKGRAIEDEIVRMCRAAHVRLIGPNCLGVINPHANISLNGSFSARMPKAGNISFISQSGALCTAVRFVVSICAVGFYFLGSGCTVRVIDPLDSWLCCLCPFCFANSTQRTTFIRVSLSLMLIFFL